MVKHTKMQNFITWVLAKCIYFEFCPMPASLGLITSKDTSLGTSQYYGVYVKFIFRFYQTRKHNYKCHSQYRPERMPSRDSMGP